MDLIYVKCIGFIAYKYPFEYCLMDKKYLFKINVVSLIEIFFSVSNYIQYDIYLNIFSVILLICYKINRGSDTTNIYCFNGDISLKEYFLCFVLL